MALPQKPTSAATAPRSRNTLEIPLPSRPKRLYCAGPPPPTITLVPPRDSTAFIVSKLVLPSGPAADPRRVQRRLYYTVGWTDLPAARVSVLASRVLEYVSPRELEDWEYRDFLRREEEAEAERRRAELATGAAALHDAGDKEARAKKKRGRPRKGGPAGPPHHEEEERATTEELPVRGDQDFGQRGPSLSTPSKLKLEELLRETEAEETGTESENAALLRQLYAEGREGVEGPYSEMDVDSEAVDLLDVSSRASSLAAPLRGPQFARASPVFSESPMAGSVSGSDVTRQGTGGGANGRPVHRQEVKKRSPASTPLQSSYFPTSTNGAALPQRDVTGFTPVGPSSLTLKTRSIPSTGTRRAASFSADETPQPNSTQKRGRKRQKKEKAVVEPEQDGWEVKRLEGDKYDYDAAGNLVRYFKVRWVGDWPEWQNPTWEPEENISQELRNEYLKNKEAKMKNGYLTGKEPAKRATKPPRPFLPAKRYSNVAEAFEGDINELGSAGQHAEDDDDQEEETFVVTDEPRAKADKNSGPSFASFDQKLAVYRNVFGKGAQ